MRIDFGGGFFEGLDKGPMHLSKRSKHRRGEVWPVVGGRTLVDDVDDDVTA